jgi:chromate reductase
MIRVLAISGSLRTGSSNAALLEAAAILAPPSVIVSPYPDLALLPAFTPDQDDAARGNVPAVAQRLRDLVGDAEALLISSPEYAHGIPGSLKNALDWLVGAVEFPDKPIGLLSGSPRSVFVKAQLIEVLTTMNGRVIPDAVVDFQLPSRAMSALQISENEDLAAKIRLALAAVERAAIKAPLDSYETKASLLT